MSGSANMLEMFKKQYNNIKKEMRLNNRMNQTKKLSRFLDIQKQQDYFKEKIEEIKIA